MSEQSSAETPHPSELRFVKGGYGPPFDEVEVVLLYCPQCEEWTAWTTAEEFNDRRGKETIHVLPGGITAINGAWLCPECDRKNEHDFAYAEGWDDAE